MPQLLAPKAFTHREIQKEYHRARKQDPYYRNMSFEEFANLRQRLGTGNDYSAGLNDNVFKQFSSLIDRGLEMTSIPGLSSDILGEVGQSFGHEELGRQLGRDLPRAAGEIGLVAASGGTSLLPQSLRAAALVGAGASSAGLKGYADTGSPGVGALQAGLTASLPAFTVWGQQGATNLLRRTGLDTTLKGGAGTASSRLGGLVERGAEEFGRQAGASFQDLINIGGTAAITGSPLPSLGEAAFMVGAGNLASLPVTMRDLVRGPRITNPVTGEVQKFRSFTEMERFMEADAVVTAAAQEAKRQSEPPIPEQRRAMRTPQRRRSAQDVDFEGDVTPDFEVDFEQEYVNKFGRVEAERRRKGIPEPIFEALEAKGYTTAQINRMSTEEAIERSVGEPRKPRDPEEVTPEDFSQPIDSSEQYSRRLAEYDQFIADTQDALLAEGYSREVVKEVMGAPLNSTEIKAQYKDYWDEAIADPDGEALARVQSMIVNQVKKAQTARQEASRKAAQTEQERLEKLSKKGEVVESLSDADIQEFASYMQTLSPDDVNAIAEAYAAATNASTTGRNATSGFADPGDAVQRAVLDWKRGKTVEGRVVDKSVGFATFLKRSASGKVMFDKKSRGAGKDQIEDVGDSPEFSQTERLDVKAKNEGKKGAEEATEFDTPKPEESSFGFNFESPELRSIAERMKPNVNIDNLMKQLEAYFYLKTNAKIVVDKSGRELQITDIEDRKRFMDVRQKFPLRGKPGAQDWKNVSSAAKRDLLPILQEIVRAQLDAQAKPGDAVQEIKIKDGRSVMNRVIGNKSWVPKQFLRRLWSTASGRRVIDAFAGSGILSSGYKGGDLLRNDQSDAFKFVSKARDMRYAISNEWTSFRNHIDAFLNRLPDDGAGFAAELTNAVRKHPDPDIRLAAAWIAQNYGVGNKPVTSTQKASFFTKMVKQARDRWKMDIEDSIREAFGDLSFNDGYKTALAATPYDFVIMDPPYGRNYYGQEANLSKEFGKNDPQALDVAQQLVLREVPFALFGVHHPKVQKLFTDLGVRYERPANAPNDEFVAIFKPTKKSMVPGMDTFKRWFSKSKVVDPQGEPLVQYHGTGVPQDFRTFNTINGNVAVHFGTAGAANQRAHWKSGAGGNLNEGSRVYPVYLKVERPLVLLDDYDPVLKTGGSRRIAETLYLQQRAEFQSTDLKNADDYIKALEKARDEPGFDYRKDTDAQREITKIEIRLKEKAGGPTYSWSEADSIQGLKGLGYDGVIYVNWFEDAQSISYAVFDPQQIKSAIGNKGSFDPDARPIDETRGATDYDRLLNNPDELDRWATQLKIDNLMTSDPWMEPETSMDYAFAVIAAYKEAGRPIPESGPIREAADSVVPAGRDYFEEADGYGSKPEEIDFYVPKFREWLAKGTPDETMGKLLETAPDPFETGGLSPTVKQQLRNIDPFNRERLAQALEDNEWTQAHGDVIEVLRSSEMDEMSIQKKLDADNDADAKALVAEKLEELVQRSGLGPGKIPGQPGDLQQSAHAFFTDYFKRISLDPALANDYVDLVMRVTTGWSDISSDIRVGGLINTKTFSGATETNTRGVSIGRLLLDNSEFLSSDVVALTRENVTGSPHVTAFLQMSHFAHELFHSNVRSLKKLAVLDPAARKRLEIYQNILDEAKAMRVSDRQFVVTSMMNSLIPERLLNAPKVKDELNAMASYVSADPTEYVTWLAETTMMSTLMKPAKTARNELRHLIEHSDEYHAQFLRGFIRDAVEIGRAITAYYNEFKAGWWSKKGLPDFDVEKQILGLKELIRPSVAHTKAMADVAQIARNLNNPLAPLEYLSSPRAIDDVDWQSVLKLHANHLSVQRTEVTKGVGDLMNQTRKLITGDPETIKRHFGPKANWFDRWVRPISMFSPKFPAARHIQNALDQHQALVSRYLHQQTAPFLQEAHKGILRVNPENPSLKQVTKSKPMSDAFNRLALDTNTVIRIQQRANKASLAKGGEGVPVDGLSRQQKDAVLGHLSPAQREHVETVFHLFQNAYARSRALMIDSQKAISAKNVALLAFRRGFKGGDPIYSMEQAEMVGDLVTSEFYLNYELNKSQVQKLREELDFLDEKTFEAVLDFTAGHVQSIKKLEDTLNASPLFFTEARQGPLIVTYREKASGKTGSRGARNQDEAEAIASELLETGQAVAGSVALKAKSFESRRFEGLDPSHVKIYVEAESAVYNSALKHLGDEDLAKRMASLYNPGEAILKDVVESRAPGFLRKQKQKPGRETLNMLDASINYYKAVARTQAAGLTKAHIAFLEMDPRLQANPVLRDQLKTATDFVISGGKSHYSVARSLLSTYFLGNNLSSMMIEGTQQFMTLAPYMVREGGAQLGTRTKVREAYQYMGQAAAEWAGALKRGSLREFKFSSKALTDDFNRARDDGLIDFGIFVDLKFAEDKTTFELTRLVNAPFKGEFSTKQLVTSLTYSYLKFMQFAYGNAAKVNSQLAFIGLWNQASKAGLKGEARYDYVREGVRQTMFGGGAAGRPIGVAKSGDMGGAVNFALTLQNYTIGMVTTYIDAFGKALGRNGIRGKNLVDARKALGQMLATQFFFAGAFGYPFAAGIVGLIQTMFPQLQIEQGSREAIEKFVEEMGGDEALGSLLGDVAVTGAASRLGSLSGLGSEFDIDVGVRTGLGSIFGVSEYGGFDISDYFGPSVQVAENMIKGVQYASQGQFAKSAQEVLPQFLKKPVELWRNNGKFYDSSNNLLFEPTVAQQIAYGVGFRPKELADIRRTQRLLRQADTAADIDNQIKFDGWAKRLLAGDASAVQAEIEAYTRQNPQRGVEEVKRAVAERAVDMSQPLDILATGRLDSEATRRRIGQSAPTTPRRRSETQKLEQRTFLEQSLGQFAMPSSRQLMRVQLIDQLIEQNPTMPRSEAVRLVDQLLAQMR